MRTTTNTFGRSTTTTTSADNTGPPGAVTTMDLIATLDSTTSTTDTA